MKLETTTMPAQVLAEGFSVHATYWAQERDAPDSASKSVQRAAYAVSLATTAGHVCAHLSDIAESLAKEHSDVAALRRSLLESGVVGTPEAPEAMPLILDGEGRLYLHRYFDYERRLARRLTQCGPAAVTGSIAQGVKAHLDRLFAANAEKLRGEHPDWQKIAAAMALLGTLTIISGGPGTGKTTTVVNLLACLLAQDPGCRIALAAPTGRGAARMLEAVRLRAAELPEEIQARLPKESFTIHRLLGVTPAASRLRHHADNLLPIDALVVDEASMLDLALATKLVEAVPESARIILLGDKDQLTAVESGSVFSELSADPRLSDECLVKVSDLCGIPVHTVCPPAPAEPNGLHDSVVWLSENFRFARDSGIGRLARDINAGDTEQLLVWLRSSKDATVKWLEDSVETPTEEAVHRILAGYDEYLDAVRTDASDQAAITEAFGRFRVLCAVREGPRGVEAINRLVSRHFRRSLEHPLEPGERSEWYPGRPVMVLRNDYVLKLFNGDIGIVLPNETGKLMVCFPDRDEGAVAPVRLPEHETAFAMTVHKSQGSEFDDVLLMLPAEYNRALTRELLYTAVTRARERVTIVSGAEVLGKTIQSPTRRHSGLIARLREIAKLGKAAERSAGSSGKDDTICPQIF